MRGFLFRDSRFVIRESVLGNALSLELLLRDLPLFLRPELLGHQLQDRPAQIAVGALALREGEAEVEEPFGRDEPGVLLELFEEVEALLPGQLEQEADRVALVAARARRVEPLLTQLPDREREVALGGGEVVALGEPEHPLGVLEVLLLEQVAAP